MRIAATKFFERQFKSDFAGTKIPVPVIDFVRWVNGSINDNSLLVDGYADFCKILVLKNVWDEIKVGVMPVDGLEPYIRSGYFARQEGELPVLCRWIDGNIVKRMSANYLHVILYSKEQLLKEKDKEDIGEADYGIVAVNSSLYEKQIDPIPPVTQMRNALGIDEGGSGELLDKKAYMDAVEFWDKHAVIK